MSAKDSSRSRKQLHHKFIQHYLSTLESVQLYWSLDKNTYYTDDFVSNAIEKNVHKYGIISIDSIPNLINCDAKKKALQMSQTSNELCCFNKQFLFSKSYKKHMKDSVITIAKQASYILTIDAIQHALLFENVSQIPSNTYETLIQLFKSKQFEVFMDGMLISLSSTHVSLRSHWIQQLALIQTEQFQAMILQNIPKDTGIVTLTALQNNLGHNHDTNTLGINTKLLSYLLNKITNNAFKLCTISPQSYVVSNRFYDLRLKRIHSILQKQGYLPFILLLDNIDQYLFKDSKQMNTFMSKYMLKNTNISRIRDGYLNIDIFCDKYANILVNIVKQNEICAEQHFYDEYIHKWLGDIDAAAHEILTKNLNSALKLRANNEIIFHNNHWIVADCVNCIWNEHMLWIIKVFVDKYMLRSVLNDSNERNKLSHRDSIAIVKYVCNDLCAIDTTFVSIVMDILQNRISVKYRKQVQDKNVLNSCQEMSKEWKRFSKIVAKLYEHFACLLKSIEIIHVSDEIRSDLLHYLVETVFAKVMNTILVAYGYIVEINFNQLKGFNLQNNSYQLTKYEREIILNEICSKLKMHMRAWELNDIKHERYSMLYKMKSFVLQFEDFVENKEVHEWKTDLNSVYQLCKLLEKLSRQLLLSGFIKQLMDEKKKENDEYGKNEKFALMHSSLKEQFICMDLNDVTDIKPFIQTWIVLYLYAKHSVVVHVPSALQSIAMILHYLDRMCNIDTNVMQLWQFIDNKQMCTVTKMNELAAKIKNNFHTL